MVLVLSSQTVRESMEVMEEKDRCIRVEDENREKLAKEIETMMVSKPYVHLF